MNQNLLKYSSHASHGKSHNRIGSTMFCTVQSQDFLLLQPAFPLHDPSGIRLIPSGCLPKNNSLLLDILIERKDFPPFLQIFFFNINNRKNAVITQIHICSPANKPIFRFNIHTFFHDNRYINITFRRAFIPCNRSI